MDLLISLLLDAIVTLFKRVCSKVNKLLTSNGQVGDSNHLKGSLPSI